MTEYDFPEDMERLPEGFKRIGYDSDTAKFTFRDGNGHLYQGEAGADYGVLTPMSAALSSSRPNAFSSDSDSSSIPPPPTHCKQKSTFQDFLHPDSIATTPSPPKKSSTPVSSFNTPTTPQQNFVKIVGKSLLPKMQGVVLNLRRSVTLATSRRTPTTFSDEVRKSERDETRGLVRCDSRSSSEPPSVVSGTRRSKTIATSRPRSKYPS